MDSPLRIPISRISTSLTNLNLLTPRPSSAMLSSTISGKIIQLVSTVLLGKIVAATSPCNLTVKLPQLQVGTIFSTASATTAMAKATPTALQIVIITWETTESAVPSNAQATPTILFKTGPEPSWAAQAPSSPTTPPSAITKPTAPALPP